MGIKFFKSNYHRLPPGEIVENIDPFHIKNVTAYYLAIFRNESEDFVL